MSAELEQRIAALAGCQHGVVTRAQLLRAGLTARMVDRLLKVKYLRVLHRGVYAVGPLLSARAREMAAVLACGPAAATSHRDAAGLWECRPYPASSEPVEVLVPRSRRTARPGILTYHVRCLDPTEVTTLDGIRVTTPPRTLLDLASVVGAGDLERAVARAEQLGLVTVDELRSLVSRWRRRHGVRALRAVLDVDGGPALTRSEAEARFLSLIREARLPAPAVNAMVHGFEVDFFWPAAAIVVEIDGFGVHGSKSAFEGDRRRDTALAAAGIHAIRVTWARLVDDRLAVLREVAQALVARPWARGP